MSQPCMYCFRNRSLDQLMTLVTEIDGHPLYLMRNQVYLGRCVLACKHHVKRLTDLSIAEARSFLTAVYRAEKAIAWAVSPDQINCAMYGDLAEHLHCHLAPKFRDSQSFGEPFLIDPCPERTLETAEMEGLCRKICAALDDQTHL